MNFKAKAYIQKLFSVLPKGENINFLFQKYVTKSLPISETDFLNKLESVKLHYEKFAKYTGNNDPRQCTYFEFGAGYDMVIPLSMSFLNFSGLTCIDIRELVFPELINDSVKRLNTFSDKLGAGDNSFPDVPEVTGKNFRQVFEDHFRITYLAPLDARKTGIDSNSIDFILSNATMEHIPQRDLPDILKECYRILKPGGIMSNVIDYRDHWSFFDNSISVYNYLQFSDSQWNRLNPSIMFQNRMRHRDYMNIIGNIGFEILEEIPNLPDESELDQLKSLNLNPHFKNNYSIYELSIKSAVIVLRKNPEN